MQPAGPIRFAPRLKALALGLIAVFLAAPLVSAQQQGSGPVTGLPLPRFVSLKSDRVNVRQGPGENYAVAWIFTRADLPVEVTQEYDNWRRIRDSDGSEGWVFQSLLAGKRTAVVAPWAVDPIPLRRDPNAAAAAAALLQPKVLSEIVECRDDWCRIRGNGYNGWVEQELLWGVYPGENFRE